MVKTRLLIDGDVIAFISAAAAQENLKDDFGYIRPFAYTIKGEAVLENMLFALKDQLKGDEMAIVLSDPEDNWRRAVDPSYKTNRTGDRPLLLDHLKQYLRDKYGAVHWAGLEADDTLGIMMTTPQAGPAHPDDFGYTAEGHAQWIAKHGVKLVCVGRDKDFKSIPGLHHSIKQDIGPRGEMLIREVTQWEADRFHMIQTLAGDAIDGFAGCPGIGMKRAAEIIDNPTRLVPQDGIKTRGVNKGEAVIRWMAEPTRDYWACIVSHYRKAGLTEADALKTARLARILRHGEYNPETEELTLWVPDMLPHG